MNIRCHVRRNSESKKKWARQTQGTVFNPPKVFIPQNLNIGTQQKSKGEKLERYPTSKTAKLPKARTEESSKFCLNIKSSRLNVILYVHTIARTVKELADKAVFVSTFAPAFQIPRNTPTIINISWPGTSDPDLNYDY